MNNFKISCFILILFLGCFVACKEEVGSFSNLLEQQKLVDSNSDFELATETYKIKYRSDGLLISGFITKPVNQNKCPTIIFNRGGNRDFGTITNRLLMYHQYLASKGYIVLASQLRGNKHSEGEDEFGGKDVNDILQLIEINKTLEFTNKKIGVLGFSRGGLNAYQVSRLSDDIHAIAVVGAPTDLLLGFESRPEMYDDLLKDMIGDSIKHRAEYEYRSPLKWADEINEPTLILHGADDWRVSVNNAELMIEKMKSLNKDFDFEIVEKGDHSLGTHKKMRNEKILGWFKKYLG